MGEVMTRSFCMMIAAGLVLTVAWHSSAAEGKAPATGAPPSSLAAPFEGADGAFAHDPKFADRKIWPDWVEKTDFAKQQWPKARVLVWNKTDTLRNPDMDSPDNWLEDGKPAKTGPDKDTDAIFPSGAKPYRLNGEGGCHFRHVTVETGANVGVRSFVIHGNLWIKKGASFAHFGLGGSENTFMRSDNAAPNFAANKIAYNKPADRSTEWLGCWLVNDELDLLSGQFIVGPGSAFLPGDRSMQRIYPKAKLILMSGSLFEKRAMQYAQTDVQVTGELLAGTPDRPLTADCTLGLSAKLKENARNVKTTDYGLMLYKEGKIVVTSADPAKARLVFKRNTRPASSYKMTPEEEKRLPTGVDMVLLGETKFDGVVFSDILKGGIIMPDPSAAKQWKNVTVGSGSAGKTLEDLLSAYKGSMNVKMDDGGIGGSVLKKQKDNQDN
jgi:hypothetical protein